MKINLIIKNFIIMIILSFALVGSFACAKKPDTISFNYSNRNRPTFTLGILFIGSIPPNVKTDILSIKKIPQIKIIGSEELKTRLLENNYQIEELFKAETYTYYNDLENIDLLSIFKEVDNDILVQFTNFLSNDLKYYKWSNLSGKKGNWLSNTKLGFLIIDAPEPELEVFINYNKVGYTPYIIQLKNGNYRLSVSKYGFILVDREIKIPDDSYIYLSDIKLPEEEHEFGMTKEDVQGSYIISVVFIVLTALGIILPIVIF